MESRAVDLRGSLHPFEEVLCRQEANPWEGREGGRQASPRSVLPSHLPPPSLLCLANPAKGYMALILLVLMQDIINQRERFLKVAEVWQVEA